MTVQPGVERVEFDRSGRHLTVYLSGDLDAATAPEITRLVLGRHQPDDEEVWLDLGAVSFCDSSGLRMLYLLDQTFSAAGARFVVYDPSPHIRRILEIVDPSTSLRLRTGPRWPG